jgi:hypothetical protein
MNVQSPIYSALTILVANFGYHCAGESPRGFAGLEGATVSLSEVNAARAIFGWPIYSTLNAVSFSGAQPGLRARVATFTQFLPVLCITTAIWASVWATPIWLLAALVD